MRYSLARCDAAHSRAGSSSGLSPCPRPIRLVQCSDMHLFADPGRQLLGLNTQDSLDAVLALILQQQAHMDVLLVTGDIAQEPLPATYQRFFGQMQQLGVPWFCLPGNHDQEAIYHSHIQLHHLPCEVVMGNWCLILLNSSVPGAIAGSLSPTTLQYLHEALQRQQHKHVIIALHHHPIAVGCDWLDQHMLKTHAAFFEVLAAFDQVKLVLHGHVHQVFERLHQGVTYLACPSTCVQFAPNQARFTLDQQAAGYRWLDLYDDGQFNTQVCRIDPGLFTMDYQGEGY